MPGVSEYTKQIVLLKNKCKNYSESSSQLFTEGILVTHQTVAHLMRGFDETQSLEYHLSPERQPSQKKCKRMTN